MTVKCQATWPKDGSFLSFYKCKKAADRICMENGLQRCFCEEHSKNKKLVAILVETTGNAQQQSQGKPRLTKEHNKGSSAVIGAIGDYDGE